MLGQFSAAIERVYTALPQAVFALSADGAVMFTSAAADLLIQIGDGPRLRQGRLLVSSAIEQTHLDRLIEQAAGSAPETVGGWARVSRIGGGAPYAAFVRPLGPADVVATGEARVLVFLHDTARQFEADRDMLRAVYGLTEAEGRLACALSAGHSLESAAALLGIRLATARSELKAVFQKIGVNRQQDLIRLLTSLSSLSRG